MQSIILDIVYSCGGIIAVSTGIYALLDKNNSSRIGTALFWILFGLVFLIGKYLDPMIIGIFILIMGTLTVCKKVKITLLPDSSEEYKYNKSLEIGQKIWIPTLSIGIIAMLLSSSKNFGGLASLGISSFVAFIIAVLLTKNSPQQGIFYEAPRMLHGMGTAIILPQLLGSLGAIFAKVGVGEVISSTMANIIPIGNPLTGVILYCVSMAIFTMIMGNGFAAFAVITAGIGVPFVINQGGNPAIIGALGLTAGYCGTLMTPMAANFNLVPVSIMEINNKYEVIKIQTPFALVLLVLHIILMYIFAF